LVLKVFSQIIILERTEYTGDSAKSGPHVSTGGNVDLLHRQLELRYEEQVRRLEEKATALSTALPGRASDEAVALALYRYAADRTARVDWALEKTGASYVTDLPSYVTLADFLIGIVAYSGLHRPALPGSLLRSEQPAPPCRFVTCYAGG
jgi:hypothetical protein